jgi:transcriptional regulator with XRE-family HTH domain
MPELLEGIGHNVRRLRGAKGWNQTELGFHAGASPSIISLIENGKRNPSTTTLAKIARALDVEVVDLFPKARVRPPRDTEAAAALPQYEVVHEEEYSPDNVEEVMARARAVRREAQGHYEGMLLVLRDSGGRIEVRVEPYEFLDDA